MGNQAGARPGFDYSASFIGQGRYNNCPFEINGVRTLTVGPVDDVSTDYAIKWMREQKGRPFSLTLGFKSPHGPRGGNSLPEKYRTLYANETSRRSPNCGVPAIFHTVGKDGTGLIDNNVHRDYLRHIAWVDDDVGRLLDTLDDLKLADDTVVIYASDNGYFLGEHNSGDKRALYDEALRIPLVVRYPKLFPKGMVNDAMVLNIDLAPTLLDLAGVKVPDTMQGRSWKALAAGEKVADWRTSFFAQYYKELGNVPTCYAVRTTMHKLVKYPGHPEWTELYDLNADPHEVKNLVSDGPLTAKLDDELAKLIKQVGYTVPKSAR
jgi:arylsulfatase A-like enzyme